MRLVILTLTALTFSSFLFGQEKVIYDWTEYFTKIRAADSLYQRNEFLRSATAYSAAFKFNHQGFSTGNKYNAARAWAAAGQSDSAISNLKKEVEVGFYEYKKLLSERAFNTIKKDTAWKGIKETVRMNRNAEDRKVGKYKPVRKRLEQILVLDQKYRTGYLETWRKYGSESQEMTELVAKMNKVDAANLKYVSKVIDNLGWISYDTIGLQANQALFLVIQHADSASQEKYLPALRQAVKENKAFATSLALLEDRVLIRRGERQIYGSQVNCDSTGKRCWILPIADESHVDERRAKIGLQPLAEYAKTWNIIYIKPD